MTEMNIPLPRLNDTKSDFDVLFYIWNEVNNSNKDVIFNFSKCDFLRSNAVAFIGGLARLIESQGRTVKFDWKTMTPKVLENLTRNRFASQFGYPMSRKTGNSVPFREDRVIDENGIMDYLTDDWLGKGWVNVSDRLKNNIASNMWEIYNNASEHSESKVGVYSCGQYHWKLKVLTLTVIDFGQGIVSNIRNFLKSDPRSVQLSASECLKWAFRKGTTTKPPGIARGLGLNLLKAFIKINHGKLEVYSNDGYVRIEGNEPEFSNKSSNFQGTIFHITLVCDEKKYKYADEK